MDVRQDSDVGEWMEDCMSFSGHSYLIHVTFHLVYRVHWLRAKAQKMRWVEELQCLQVEMESAVRFFRYQRQIWHAKEEVIGFQLQPGHVAWAARQSAMWCSLATQAESKLSTLLKYNPPCYDRGSDFSARLLTGYDYGTPQVSSRISHGQSSQSAEVSHVG